MAWDGDNTKRSKMTPNETQMASTMQEFINSENYINEFNKIETTLTVGNIIQSSFAAASNIHFSENEHRLKIHKNGRLRWRRNSTSK